MDKQPKRRKFYDNPYTLLTENNTNELNKVKIKVSM